MAKKRDTEETPQVEVEAGPEETIVAEAPPPEPAPPAPEVTTAEEWATRKGMLPKFVEVPAPFSRAGALKRQQLNPLFEKFAAAQALCGWATGKELTEADFDAAVTQLTNHIYR